MIRKPVRVTPTNLFQPDGRSSAEGSLSDTTDVSRRGIARIAAGKADVPPDLAEPLRHATTLIANLRVVLPECEGDRNVMNADRDPAQRVLLERALSSIFGAPGNPGRSATKAGRKSRSVGSNAPGKQWNNLT